VVGTRYISKLSEPTRRFKMWLLILIVITRSMNYQLMTKRAHGTIPNYFASFTLDFHPGSEGPEWGKNASILEIDLNDNRLRTLTKNLAPAILRIGGNEADKMIYALDGVKCNGNYFCLTPDRWLDILEFGNYTGVQILYDLNLMPGREKSLKDPWDPSNSASLLEFTAKSGYVPWFELGNEAQGGFTGDVSSKDFETLRGLINKNWPNRRSRPKIYGPSCHINADWIMDFCEGGGCDAVDVFGFHLYTGYGLAKHIAEQIPSSDFINDMEKLVLTVRDLIPMNKTIALTETASCWHSGGPGTSNAFMDTFVYLSQLNFVASRRNTDSVMRQTLVGGYYSLIDNKDFHTNPNYFVTALFKALVGTTVLKIHRQAVIGTDICGTIFLFAYCGKDAGTVVFSYANLGEREPIGYHDDIFQMKGLNAVPRTEYSMTSDGLSSRKIYLNGNLLEVDDAGNLPKMKGNEATGDISLPGKSAGFITFKVAIPACQ